MFRLFKVAQFAFARSPVDLENLEALLRKQTSSQTFSKNVLHVSSVCQRQCSLSMNRKRGSLISLLAQKITRFLKWNGGGGF